MRPAEESEDAVVDMSSLLDVMFILIIFFLATATFKQQERDLRVNLPETSAQPQTLSSAPKTIVINVRQDGAYKVGTRRVDLDGVRKIVSQAVSENPQQKVLVRGDRKALHGQVASAISMCKRAGVLKANLGYSHKPR